MADHEGRCDGSGRFRIELPRTTSARQYGLTVTAMTPGYGFGWTDLDPDADPPVADVTLRNERAEFTPKLRFQFLNTAPGCDGGGNDCRIREWRIAELRPHVFRGRSPRFNEVAFRERDDDSLHAKKFHRVNIRTKIQFARQDAMAAAMARKKRNALPF